MVRSDVNTRHATVLQWSCWEAEAQVTMMILIQPLFIVFMGLVPSLCLKVGYTTMMTVSLVYLYSVPASGGGTFAAV